MNPLSLSNTKMQKWMLPIVQAFQNLSRRDQLALLVLGLFLLCFGLGFGGWTVHSKANMAQKNYDNAMADVFWLRSQAGNIKSNQTQNLSKTDSIKQILTQSGVANAQVIENGTHVQVSFVQSQSSVITNIFNQFEQQGFTIEQLLINQSSVDKLEVQSVVAIQ